MTESEVKLGENFLKIQPKYKEYKKNGWENNL